ncbi:MULTISPECIES: hypothetical protein [Sphingomonas]|uniref:hypothetical protein n=1 Tax=Sphingomonas TaxID=13687 RepID=UPI0013B37717|nr:MULTISPECIES: hypothetical protein [Sphingomonas]
MRRNKPNRFAIPSNTDWGKAMIAMILSAQAGGKQVFISRTGICIAGVTPKASTSC